MENKEFIEELEIQRKVVEALKGDTVGKSIKGLQLMVKEKDFERFKAILIKMVERGELISREHTLTLPLEAVPAEAEIEEATPPLADSGYVQPALRTNKIMELLGASAEPLTRKEIEAGIGHGKSLYLDLERMVGEGLLSKTEKPGQLRKPACCYAIAPVVAKDETPPPRRSCVTIHRSKKKLHPIIKESERWKRLADKCDKTGREFPEEDLTWEGYEGNQSKDKGRITPSALLRDAIGSLECLFDPEDTLIQFIHESDAQDYSWRVCYALEQLHAIKPIVDALCLGPVLQVSSITEDLQEKYLEPGGDGFPGWCTWLPSWYLTMHLETIMPLISDIEIATKDAEDAEMRATELRKTIEASKEALVKSVAEGLEKILETAGLPNLMEGDA